MAKLYLVRRNLEVFTGPMTLVEMKDAYKRMQFGLQDEVAGHCGPWVVFEHLEKIKKFYPEVARIVHDDMIAGWNISSDNEGKLINEDTKRIAIKSVRGMSLALVFLLIAIVAFVAALYMANAAKISVKAREQQESGLSPKDLQLLLDLRDSAGYNRYIDEHGGELAAQISHDEVGEQEWLPYLRFYAFAHDGQLAGLDPKYLRGTTAPSAPVDCSLRTWRRRWRTSSQSWNELLTGHQLVRAHWARLIAWDPYWIKRRENKGWIGTTNYYTACLAMADRALNEVGVELVAELSKTQWNKLGFDKIKARLTWLRSAVEGQALAATPRPAQTKGEGGGIGLWTCFEAARDLAALDKCRTVVNGDATWLAYNEERYGWNVLRLAAAQRGHLAPGLLAVLQQQDDKLNKEDHYTRFDYRPEATLLKSLVTPGLPAEKAVEKTQTAFPSVKMSH